MTGKTESQVRLIAAVLCAVLAVAAVSAAIAILCNAAEVRRIKSETFTLADIAGAETVEIDGVEFEYYGEMLQIGGTDGVTEAVKKLSGMTLIKASCKFPDGEIVRFYAGGEKKFWIFSGRNDLTRENGRILAFAGGLRYQIADTEEADALTDDLYERWLGAQSKFTLADLGYGEVVGGLVRAEFASSDGTREIPLTETTVSEVKSRLGELCFIREDGRNIRGEVVNLYAGDEVLSLFIGRKQNSAQYRTYVTGADGAVYRECIKSNPTELWEYLVGL